MSVNEVELFILDLVVDGTINETNKVDNLIAILEVTETAGIQLVPRNFIVEQKINSLIEKKLMSVLGFYNTFKVLDVKEFKQRSMVVVVEWT